MKAKLLRSFLLLALCASSLAAVRAGEKSATVTGSIRPIGKQSPAALLTLVKIDLLAATKAALAAVPGQALAAELEVEHGSLVYCVEIVGADATVTEVAIDAGNGQVLAREAKRAEKHEEKEKRGHGKKSRGHKHENDEEDEGEDDGKK